MKKKRIIPLVLFRNGYVVQSRNFSNHRSLGLLDGTLERLEDWAADEVIVLDISNSSDPLLGRNDLATKTEHDFISTLKKHSARNSMPLTVGGGIKSVKDTDIIFQSGADKIYLNTLLHQDPKTVEAIVNKYGSQAVVGGIDIRWIKQSPVAYYLNGSSAIKKDVNQLIEHYINLGVGEIMINSIDRDGLKNGFDVDILGYLPDPVLPITLCGGAGNPTHFVEPLKSLKIDGVVAGNYFQHVENSVPLVRNHLSKLGLPVRKVVRLNSNQWEL
jgi:cyclase